MKAIDLLNKIANDVKLPKKIKYKNCIFENRCVIDYWCKKTETCLDELILMQNLNDEVEILEEEKKLPEKLGECAYVDGEIAYSWSKSEAVLKTKINEIIDYLKSKGDK